MISLHFFHTNDLHSHLNHWGSLVHYLNLERERLHREDQEYLTLDLGDHMDRVNPLTEGLLGRGNVKLLNDADYDYITIGNNEGITFTKETLDMVYDDRKFEVILANLFDQSGHRPDWCLPYKICNMKGVSVGIIGLTAAFAKFYRQLGWDVRDPFAVLKPLVRQLRPKVDVLVLMSHVGLPFDEQVADQLDGIDVILGAHTHHALEEGLTVESTLIAQAGKFGRYLGHVVVEFDEVNRCITHKGANLITLRDTPDQRTQQEINRLTQEAITNMQEPVTVINHPMSVSWFKDTELTYLMADALRKWCNADVGMVNAGVILGGLKPGVVTRYDIHHICPHPINPCRVNVSGEEILLMIRIGLKKEFQNYALKGFGFRGKVLGKLMFSNLTYKETGIGPGISDVRVYGIPIDPHQIYSVGTIDVFTFGTFMPPIVKAEQRFYLPETLRDLLAWRLNNQADSAY